MSPKPSILQSLLSWLVLRRTSTVCLLWLPRVLPLFLLLFGPQPKQFLVTVVAHGPTRVLQVIDLATHVVQSPAVQPTPDLLPFLLPGRRAHTRQLEQAAKRRAAAAAAAVAAPYRPSADPPSLACSPPKSGAGSLGVTGSSPGEARQAGAGQEGHSAPPPPGSNSQPVATQLQHMVSQAWSRVTYSMHGGPSKAVAHPSSSSSQGGTQGAGTVVVRPGFHGVRSAFADPEALVRAMEGTGAMGGELQQGLVLSLAGVGVSVVSGWNAHSKTCWGGRGGWGAAYSGRWLAFLGAFAVFMCATIALL